MSVRSEVLTGFLSYEFLAGCHNDCHTENHKKNSYDELKSFNHEDTCSSSECLYEGYEALDECRECYDKHNHEWRDKRSHLSACDFKEYAECNKHECAEKLVRTSEERPDVGVSNLSENVSEYKCDERRNIFVAEDFSPSSSCIHVINTEKLLE